MVLTARACGAPGRPARVLEWGRGEVDLDQICADRFTSVSAWRVGAGRAQRGCGFRV
jgi:hypothetical protein